MPKPAPTDIEAEVKAIYAELDRRPLERNCTALTTCCRFKLTGETPYLTKGEALVAKLRALVAKLPRDVRAAS